MIKIGDKSTQWIEALTIQKGRNRVKQEMVKYTGTVTYINERHHWYTVTFELPGGTFRESYWMGVKMT